MTVVCSQLDANISLGMHYNITRYSLAYSVWSQLDSSIIFGMHYDITRYSLRMVLREILVVSTTEIYLVEDFKKLVIQIHIYISLRETNARGKQSTLYVRSTYSF